MKKIILLFSILCFCTTVSGQGIKFFGGNVEDAMDKAKAEDKRIFMDFYTEWCAPCKAIAQNVFPTAEAGEYFNAKYVNMKIDAEKGMGRVYRDKYEINSFPTFIIMDSDGEILARWSGGGGITPEAFIALVERQIERGPAPTEEDIKTAQMIERMNRESRQNMPGVRAFEGTYAEALAKAKAEGKKLFVDCYTEWCNPCKLMDANVFPRQDVGDFINSRFVFLKLDMEKGEGPEVGKKFEVNSYPTFLMIDANGNEISRVMGNMLPNVFIARVNAAIDPTKTYEALKARYDAGERGEEFMRDYIGALGAQRKNEEATAAAIKEFMAALPEAEKFKYKNWDYWTMYNNSAFGTENFDFILKNRSKFEAAGLVGMWLKDQTIEGYKWTAFGKEPSSATLARVDELAQTLKLTDDPVIMLFRAAADARLNGKVDEMIDLYEEYGRMMLNEDDQRSYLMYVVNVMPETTDEQRRRLGSFTRDPDVRGWVVTRDQKMQ